MPLPPAPVHSDRTGAGCICRQPQLPGSPVGQIELVRAATSWDKFFNLSGPRVGERPSVSWLVEPRDPGSTSANAQHVRRARSL
jgi:hypothetical protein